MITTISFAFIVEDSSARSSASPPTAIRNRIRRFGSSARPVARATAPAFFAVPRRAHPVHRSRARFVGFADSGTHFVASHDSEAAAHSIRVDVYLCKVKPVRDLGSDHSFAGVLASRAAASSLAGEMFSTSASRSSSSS